MVMGTNFSREVSFRVERLGVRTGQRLQLGTETSQEILNKLRPVDHGLVVLGTVDRSTAELLQLGRASASVAAGATTPAIILVNRQKR